jgi:hypothetical protein
MNQGQIRRDIKELLGLIFPSVTAIILQDVNGVKPQLPFISFRDRTVVSDGEDERTIPDNSGDYIVKGDRDFTLDIQYHGQYANENINKFYTLLSSDVYEEFLVDKNLAVRGTLSMGDISISRDGSYLERAQVSLLMGTVSEFQLNNELIEKVVGTGEVKNEANNTVQNVNFEAEVI